MAFSEICIYQVHPQKIEAFETLMDEVQAFLKRQNGLLLLRFAKRTHHADMEQIRDGLPPLSIRRVVKASNICCIGNSIAKKTTASRKRISTKVIGKP